MHYPSGNDVQSMMMYEAKKKKAGIAYILWFLFGILGVHRFYAGKAFSGFCQLVVGIVALLTLFAPFLFFIWAIWWVYDAIVMPGWISAYNVELAQSISAPKPSPVASATHDPAPVAIGEQAIGESVMAKDSVEERLEQLQNLLEKDLISFDEFIQRREKILDEISPG